MSDALLAVAVLGLVALPMAAIAAFLESSVRIRPSADARPSKEGAA